MATITRQEIIEAFERLGQLAEARRLLQEMSGAREDVWRAVEPFLVPGNELKAQYAFVDLWEALYGNT